MKPYAVSLSERAIDDLIDIHSWIAGQADAQIADAYLDRLRTQIDALSTFPDRGTPRPKWGPDIRSLSFERRLIVAYRVVGQEVWIERVVHGARELGQLFVN